MIAFPAPKHPARGLARFRFLRTPHSKDTAAFHREPRHRGAVISVCLLTSTLLWFFFSMQQEHTVPLELPTQVQNLNPDEALAVLPPQTIRVQVEGAGIQLLRLYYNPPTVNLNASADVISLEAAAKEVTKTVRLESVMPRTFVVRKEPRLTRTIPVESRFRVTTPPAFDLTTPIRLDPDSIRVSGATSIIERLAAWPTRAQTFANVRDTLRATVPLLDTLSGLVFRSHETVSVYAVSEEFTEGSREITVLIPGAPQGENLVTLSPSTITVTYQVPLSKYEASLRAEDFFATVSFDEIRSDTTGSVRPRLHFPENLMLREVVFSPTTLQYYNVLVDVR